MASIEHSGHLASYPPPGIQLKEQNPSGSTHNDGCGCASCQSIQLQKSSQTIQREDDKPKGAAARAGATTAKGAGQAAKAAGPKTTYGNKDFVTSKNANILGKGADSDGISTFTTEKAVIGQKYGFTKSSIPRNATVRILSEATSRDSNKKPSVKVAKVRVDSIPDGKNQKLKGMVLWTSRSNVSAEPDKAGNSKITQSNATVRSEPTDVQGPKFIPSGTTVKVINTHAIEDFPEAIRLKNNDKRNKFHKQRYMRLYLNVTYQGSDGTPKSAWISAADVEGGFANEVLGVSKATLESADPTHMTVGVKNTPLLKKSGKHYPETKPRTLLTKGAYVTITQESADKKYLKVSTEDGSFSNVWTSKGNLDKSKKKEIGPMTYYEINNDDARIRVEKDGFSSAKQSLALGDYVKIHLEEDGYVQISKVTRNGDARVVSKDKFWVKTDYLAPGWSTDIKGKNASWGKVVIGKKTVSKYKGQDDLVNLGGSGGKMKQVSKEAYPNLSRMITAAKNNKDAAGNADPVNIVLNSCFRTFFSQKYFDDNEHKKGFNTAATPGWSAHQDSNAFDLNNLKSKKVYKWLKYNAWKYNIVQNVRASNERHHWAYLPGKGQKGYYTTWKTKSNESW